MAENMQSSMKMMSNMNTMMECFVLQHLDVVPSVHPEGEHKYSLSIQIRNACAFPLKGVFITVSSADKENSSCSFSSEEEEPSSQFQSSTFDLDGNGSHAVQTQIAFHSSCNLNVRIALPSPGTGEEISMVHHHSIIAC
ncbi:hypothetical protein WA556_001970 [Blastocystis sp. ATCC 50177/Nand II]